MSETHPVFGVVAERDYRAYGIHSKPGWEDDLNVSEKALLFSLRAEVQEAANMVAEMAREFDRANLELIRFVRKYRDGK